MRKDIKLKHEVRGKVQNSKEYMPISI